MTFGEKIKKIRMDNNMTQEELAEKLLVTRTAISKWETGNGYPSIDSFQAISKLFGISIDELLSDDDIECQKILEEKHAKKAYRAAFLILGLTMAVSLISYFYPLPGLRLVSLFGMVAYIMCAAFARPKYRRIEAKKYIVTYVLSRIVVLLIVTAVVISTILRL